MDKDWKWNWTTIVCLWAHNNSDHDREEHDYYATDPIAIDYLFDVENFSDNIREPACWEWNLSERIKKYGNNVVSSDLIDRWYGRWNIDFLNCNKQWNWDIITNPPYRYAREFIEKSLELIPDGNKVAMFLRIQFLESKGRYTLWKEYPPKKVYVFSGRMWCAMNNNFEAHSQSAVPYAWYVWEKWYKWPTIIDWILVDNKRIWKQ